ncbi:hypothetical protein QE152_g985 [Popillia japonica]|uniref:Uncharacterized protein n=1 Tax=Popillia japonica TaxID=7064 RepID=A0AAW1N743_POPJA
MQFKLSRIREERSVSLYFRICSSSYLEFGKKDKDDDIDMPCRVAIKRFIENMTFPERTVKGPPQGDKFRSNVEFTLQNCLKLRDSYFRKEFKDLLKVINFDLTLNLHCRTV